MTHYKLAAYKILQDQDSYFPKTNDNTLENVLNYVFIILGVIAVLMVVYSGIQLIISQGNADKVATARRTILYSIVGLVIIISAGAIVNFFVVRL